MLRAEAKYYLIVKDETLKPVKKNLRIAVGSSPEGPFGEASAPFTPSWVEGPSAIRIGDDYLVYFDCYTKGRYGAVRSRNLKDWEDVTSRWSSPKGRGMARCCRCPSRSSTSYPRTDKSPWLAAGCSSFSRVDDGTSGM